MTKAQYKKVKKLYDELEDIKNAVESIAENLQEKYNNMSEKAQESDKGQRREQSWACLNDAVSSMTSALEEMDNSLCDYDEYAD